MKITYGTVELCCQECGTFDVGVYQPPKAWCLKHAPAPVIDKGECGAVDPKSGYRCAHEPGHLDRGVPHATISGERQWRGQPTADAALSEVDDPAAMALRIVQIHDRAGNINEATALLATFAERVRREAVEECAKVADAHGRLCKDALAWLPHNISKDIRSLTRAGSEK